MTGVGGDDVVKGDSETADAKDAAADVQPPLKKARLDPPGGKEEEEVLTADTAAEAVRKEVHDEESESDDDSIDFDKLVEAQEQTQEEGADAAPAKRTKRTRGGRPDRKKERKKLRWQQAIVTVHEAKRPLPKSVQKLPWEVKKALKKLGSQASDAKATDEVPAKPGQDERPHRCPHPIARDAPLDYGDTAPATEHEKAVDVDDAFRKAEKEGERRLLADAQLQARTVFVTNLPFKVCTPHGVSGLLDKCGKVEDVNIPKDKTGNPCGYAHVRFETPEMAASAVKQCDWLEVKDPDKDEKKDRVIRVFPSARGTKSEFELPVKIREELAALVRDRYEGQNLSAVRQAWQKQHEGQALRVEKWGFKNFSKAMDTVEGVTLEHHLGKHLTVLGFVTGSAKHQDHLLAKQKQAEENQSKAAEAAAASSKGEAAPSSAEGTAPTQCQPEEEAKAAEVSTNGEHPSKAAEAAAASSKVEAAPSSAEGTAPTQCQPEEEAKAKPTGE